MEIYGIEHIIYMIVSLFIMAGLIVLFKFLIPKDKRYVLFKVLAGIGLILIIIYRIVVSKSRGGTFIDFLPDTYCSMMGFIMPLVILCFSPKTKIFQFVMFAGMFGGAITFFYPDFLVYFDNIFNIHPFTALLYHTLMLFNFLCAIILGYFKPNFKNWASFPIGLAFLVVLGEFGNSVLDQYNNMYLNAPLLSGTPLTWWLVGLLMIIVYTIILQIYEMIALQKNEWSVIKLYSRLKNKFFIKNKNIANINENNGSINNDGNYSENKSISDEEKQTK